MANRNQFEPIKTKLAGVTFDGRQSVCAKLFENVKLSLVREPENQYDKNAVAVIFEGQQCGYVPRELARILAEFIDSGLALEAVVTSLVGGGDLSIGVNVRIQETSNGNSETNGRESAFSTNHKDWIEKEDRDEALVQFVEPTLQLTSEQKKIVAYDVEGDTTLNVIAFAGTGKTTTLIEYSRARPTLQFLYVAFNRSVRIEAQKKFPPNVMCRTSHSLAYSEFGAPHENRIVETLRLSTVKNLLGLNSYKEAKTVEETLTNFLISADLKFSKTHIPWLSPNDTRSPGFYLDMAARFWVMMCDPNNQSKIMLHDGYLKLYQLSKPKLYYDSILLDEAQDTNPVVADIILSQSCPKILVGDPHQQIYAWRGAEDAMGRIEADDALYLTQTFRFGEEIAWLANEILETFKGETKRVRGVAPRTDKIQPGDFAVIARTNATLFDEAVTLSKSHKVAFLGGIKGYRFNDITNVYLLYAFRKSEINSPFIRSFPSYPALKDYAEEAQDWEMIANCRVVEKYKNRIPDVVEEIRTAAVDKEFAEVVLTTAHKAKGHEFSRIRICNDFPLFFPEGDLSEAPIIPREEANLLYVTVTRAKHFIEFTRHNDWKRFISFNESPGFEKILDFFGFTGGESLLDVSKPQPETSDFGAAAESSSRISQPEKTKIVSNDKLGSRSGTSMTVVRAGPKNFSALCHKYHPTFIKFWDSRIVEDSVSIKRVCSYVKKSIVSGVHAKSVLNKGCSYGVVFDNGAPVVELDIASALATASLELLVRPVHHIVSVLERDNPLIETWTTLLKYLENGKAAVTKEEIKSLFNHQAVILLIREYYDMEWAEERMDELERYYYDLVSDFDNTWRFILGRDFDFALHTLIKLLVFGRRNTAIEFLDCALGLSAYFSYFEGKFVLEEHENNFKEWILSERGPLYYGTVEKWLGAAQALRMLLAEDDLAVMIMEKAEKAASECYQQIYCAESWLCLFNDRDKAENCMMEAEHLALASWDWIKCAEAWRNLFGDSEREQMCLEQS